MGATGKDVWDETCLVTITPIGGSDIEFAGRTKNIDVNTGTKDMEGMPVNSGGRAVRQKPEEDSEWNFSDCYFVGIQTTGTDISPAQIFEDWSNVDTSDPRSVSASRNRVKVRVAVLYTDDTTADSAGGAVASNSAGYRIVCANAYIVEFKEKWDDGLLKADFKLKFAPFDLAGNANRKREDTETTGISALGSYTTSQNWD